jgi:hypothetical protein
MIYTICRFGPRDDSIREIQIGVQFQLQKREVDVDDDRDFVVVGRGSGGERVIRSSCLDNNYFKVNTDGLHMKADIVLRTTNQIDIAKNMQWPAS